MRKKSYFNYEIKKNQNDEEKVKTMKLRSHNYEENIKMIRLEVIIMIFKVIIMREKSKL